MKLKTRIKSFWRHNKKFVPMYVTIIQTMIGIFLLPFTFWGAIHAFSLSIIWSLLWIAERKADFYRRSVFVAHHEAWRTARLVLYEVIKKIYEYKSKDNETED